MSGFVLDTHLYIEAYRSPGDRDRLRGFLERWGARVWVSSVVELELLSGSRSPEEAARLRAAFFARWEAVDRLEAPSEVDWRTAASVQATLAARGDIQLRSTPMSFINDTLIASWASRRRLTVVSSNLKDFSRIGTVLDFSLVEPWP